MQRSYFSSTTCLAVAGLLSLTLPAHPATAGGGSAAEAVQLASNDAPGGSSGEEAYPRLEVEIDFEVQNDWTFESDDPDAEQNDLFTTTEPALGFYFLPGLSLQAGLVLEPVLDPDPREDRVFEDHGLFVEQLYLSYEHDTFSVFGGKFNLPFGVAWDLTPGVYGTDIAEDFYEQTERIGFGGSLNFGGVGLGGDGFGEHSLTAQTFFLDTSVLSDSVFTDRGRTRERDGGVSNTEDLSSFAASLDGGNFPDMPLDLNYHLGFIYQAAGEGDPEDEFGFAAALHGGVDLAEDLRVAPIVEYVHFENAEGLDQQRDIVTGGAALLHGPWNLSLAYSRVFTDPNSAAVEDLDVDQFQVSAGYAFDFGLDVDLGYKLVDEESIDTHIFGVILHYALDFTVPSG